MRLLRTGSTRAVLLTNKYAIKFPIGVLCTDNTFYGRMHGILRGWLANRTEYKWSSYGEFTFLCPIKYSFLFSFVVVMPRVDPIPRDEFYNISPFNFSYEHKLDSYGLFNNKVVVVDYG